MASGVVTDIAIRSSLTSSRKSDEEKWLADGTGRGAGRLLLRCLGGKGHWYFRYTLPSGQRDTLALGSYVAAKKLAGHDETGRSYSLSQAREEAIRLGALLKDPATRDIRAHIKAIERARQVAAQSRADALLADERAKHARERHTLAALLTFYWEYLQRGGKASAANVESALRLHMLAGNPALCSKPAKEVTRAELASVIRGLVEQNKSRTAGLVRSYLGSAYRLAIGAEGNAKAPAALIAFNINSNPVDGIQALSVRRRRRVLNEVELRAVLRHLCKSESISAALLLACLLAGGQRPAQMARATRADFDQAQGALLLWDGKGRRLEARPHLLPLASKARSLIERLLVRAAAQKSDLIFSSDGSDPVLMSSMGRWLLGMVDALTASGELSSPMQAKDLRRTVETMMARMSISRDLRAQVMSHGLSGVQNQHYDQHDYFGEKQAILKQWERFLTDLDPSAL